MFTKTHFCLKLNQVSTETEIKKVIVELEILILIIIMEGLGAFRDR